MHVLSLIPLLAVLSAPLTLALPQERAHHHRCDVNNTTITHTVTETKTVFASASSSAPSQVLVATPVSSSSASKSSSSSASKAASSSASKAASSSVSSSVSKSASSSASASKASSSSASKASSTSASSTNVATTSTTSKAASSSLASASKSSSASATSTAAASSTTDADAQTYLTLHNNFRAHYGASAVTWNHTLATYAKSTTNTCVFKHTGGPYGENLAAGVGGGYNITSGFNSWANEASEYDASNPQYSHFTQVVWKGTTQIGCATSACADGTIFTGYGSPSTYMVCEYYPPGNVIGQFAQNVGTYQA